jgi:hypothetical protein
MIDLSLVGALSGSTRAGAGPWCRGALLGALDRAAQSSGLATTAGNVSTPASAA